MENSTENTALKGLTTNETCAEGKGKGTQGGGGDSLIWPIQGFAAGQGMVFSLSVLNRVYNFL